MPSGQKVYYLLLLKQVIKSMMWSIKHAQLFQTESKLHYFSWKVRNKTQACLLLQKNNRRWDYFSVTAHTEIFPAISFHDHSRYPCGTKQNLKHIMLIVFITHNHNLFPQNGKVLPFLKTDYASLKINLQMFAQRSFHVWMLIGGMKTTALSLGLFLIACSCTVLLGKRNRFKYTSTLAQDPPDLTKIFSTPLLLIL